LDPWGLSGLITVAGNGVLFIALMAYKKLRYAELFHPARHSVMATLGLLAIPIILLVPGLVITAGTLNAIVVKFLPMTPDEQAVLEAMVSSDVLALLFGCIAAPFLEEMLFRGIILRSFLTQYSRTASILGSSLLFAIAHMNVYQFITAFTVGIAAGWLYERTRSLWPCIVLHAGYNAFVAYAHNFFSTNLTGDFSVTFYASAFVLAIGAFALLLKMLMPAKE
jgi:membrane protease YdiL (CAAX protease family)